VAIGCICVGSSSMSLRYLWIYTNIPNFFFDILWSMSVVVSGYYGYEWCELVE